MDNATPQICNCGKEVFNSKREAMDLALAIKRRKKDPSHVSAYVCPELPDKWHLTSRTSMSLHKKSQTKFLNKKQKYKYK